MGLMYDLVSMYSILTLAVYPQYSKKVLGTVLAKNKVKIIVNIPWFAMKNDVSGNLRSWDIIIVSHVEWTLAYFYSCHINEALKTTLSALFDFSNQYIFRAFLLSELQMPSHMFFIMPILFQCFKLNFWLIENK